MIKLTGLFFVICMVNANAVTLTQTAPGDILFDLNSVTPIEAGTYFSNSQSSSINATLLSIDDIPGSTRWTVFAKLSAVIPGIKVRIKRTGNGTGSTAPTGNIGNRRLNDAVTWVQLFKGKGSRLNIPMQTQIYRLGVGDGNGIFETDIDFKVETQ